MFKLSDKLMDEAFKEFMSQRIQDCYANNVLTDGEYKKWSEKMSKIRDKISDLLGPEYDGLLFDFDSAVGLRFGIETDSSYRQGFSDGMKFMLQAGEKHV